MFLASKGWLAVLARGTRSWLLIGQPSDTPASDWSDVSKHSDACQTWRLLSVMYRPLRRHTYHSVTNNTNSSETILSPHWSKGAHADFSLVKTFSSTREVKQKVNKPTQLALAAFDFFSPSLSDFWFICYLEVWSHCWAGRRRICWRWSPRGWWGTSWGRREGREEKSGRPMLTRTLAQLWRRHHNHFWSLGIKLGNLHFQRQTFLWFRIFWASSNCTQTPIFIIN